MQDGQTNTTLRSAYLAGPMRGIEDFNFPAFKEASRWLKYQGWTVYSPADRDEADHRLPSNSELRQQGHDWSGTHGLDYFMQFDLPAVCRCDAVVCLPDWEKSQGARLETMVAVEIGHPVFEITFKGGCWQLTSVSPDYIAVTFADQSLGFFSMSEDHWDEVRESPYGVSIAEEANQKMRTFNTGATRNLEVDPDYEGFLSPLAVHMYGAYMHAHRTQADGTTRASDNWQLGIPLDSFIKSMTRHLHDLQLIHDGYPELAREDLDSALAGLFFNVQGYMHFTMKERIEAAKQGDQG